MNIVWDEKKNQANYEKHGIRFEEAQTVLFCDVGIDLIDNSANEPRQITIGFSAALNLLLVVYVYREEDTIRIISARKATKKEREQYEKRV